MIATFQVGEESYRVEIIDPLQVRIARRLLAGKEAPSIPNGRIVRGETGVNTGWSWHIDPTDFEFADLTIELCDGLPSYVEDGSLTGDTSALVGQAGRAGAGTVSAAKTERPKEPAGSGVELAGEPAGRLRHPWPLRDEN